MSWIDEMNMMAEKSRPFLFILDFELDYPVILALDDIDPKHILYSFKGINNLNTFLPNDKRIEMKADPISFEDFSEKFTRVQNEIHAGNTYLLNLCFRTPVLVNFELKDLMYFSHAPYKLWLKDKFVLFSPESFIKTNGNRISTFPMKGTLEKTGKDSVNTLLNDVKEAAEHATITDLLRNDLGRVANNIRVKRYRYVDEIKTNEKTILQVSSEITGEIDPELSARPGDILKEILPAGSITGAPKKKTIEIIKDIEDHERGYYTGVFGIFDGKNIDSAVMIRFIEKSGKRYFYKSGGGITFMSDARKEYDEIIQKIYVPVY